MASFRVGLKTFSRAAGKTATAAMAYRCGTVVQDERTGLTFDYRRRYGVEHTATFCPAGAPAWAFDPSKLWNAAEAAETRSNARTARELLVSLPAELTREQRAALTDDLARMLVTRYAVAVTAAVHAPDRRGDQRNFHAHILFTTRTVTAAGFGAKVRALDDRKTGPEETDALRAITAGLINEHLARAGLTVQVDHRSLADQAKAAEARGDLAAAVLLTREPCRRESRAVVEQRRRGLPAAEGWNDAVRTSNRMVLAGYLRGARAATRGGVSVGSSTSPARGTRLAGPGARAIAAQARQARRRQRQDERAAERFAAMLERTRVEIAEQNRRILFAYCCTFGRSLADAQALAFHGARDPGCYGALRRALEAHAAVEEARDGVDAARQFRGEAMVHTAEARAALERTDAEPAPSRLHVLSRREWAQKREAQRVAVAQAQGAEREASGGAGMVTATERLRLAQRTLDEVETQRRHAYGLPGETPALVSPQAVNDGHHFEPRPLTLTSTPPRVRLR